MTMLEPLATVLAYQDGRPPVLELDRDPNEVEERVQVDRRKLEQMISGVTDECNNGDFIPTAEDFFAKIMRLSGATISWPTRLKIGAKTKKDPFVKIIGLPLQVQRAKEQVLEILRARQNRVTLKMDVPFTDHSHIIGRSGKNTQRVMKETGCHIHFPDSNKNRDMDKSNQVSIAGSLKAVEQARHQIRELAPLSVSFEMKTVKPGVDVEQMASSAALEEWVGFKDLNVVVRFNRASRTPYCMVRGSVYQREQIKQCVARLCQHMFQPGSKVQFSTALEVLPPQQPSVIGPKGRCINAISTRTGAQIHYPVEGEASRGASTFYIQACELESVIAARQHILGCLPVVLMFDMRVDQGRGVDLSVLEQDYNCSISVKFKQQAESKSVLVRGMECDLSKLYAVRKQLIQDPEPPIFCSDYEFMRDWNEPVALLNGYPLTPAQVSPLLPPSIQVPMGSLSIAPTPTMLVSPISPVFSPAFVPNNVSPVMPVQQMMNGLMPSYLPPTSASLRVESHVAPMEMVPQQQVIPQQYQEAEAESRPQTPKAAHRPSASVERSPEEEVNVIVRHVPMPDPKSVPHHHVAAKDPNPDSPLATGVKNFLDESRNRDGFKDGWNKAPGAERQAVAELSHLQQTANKTMREPPKGPRTPTGDWMGLLCSKSMPTEMMRTLVQVQQQLTLEQSELPSPGLPVIPEGRVQNGVSPWPRRMTQPNGACKNFGASSYLDDMRKVECDVGCHRDLDALFEALALTELSDVFLDQEVDFETFLEMNDEDFRSLGIVKLGQRVKLRIAAAQIKQNIQQELSSAQLC